MSINQHDIPTGSDFGAHTLCNRLTVPEIACYRRTTAGDAVIITYAVRGPLESLWRGVMLFTIGDETTEAGSGPHPTPQGAVLALAAAQAANVG